MKIHKMFCVDDEIAYKLNGINASELVNRLLKLHFESQVPKTLQEMEKELAVLDLQEEYANKLEALNAGK